MNNKVIFILFYLTFSSGIVFAQKTQFVKANKDFFDETSNTQLYKGDIYKLDSTGIAKGKNDQNVLKKFFTVNDKKCFAKNDVDIINSADDLTKTKDDYVKINSDGSLHIDLSSIQTIQTNDTIWLIGKGKLTFVETKITTIKDASNQFRLIIPNTLTIWYLKKDLKEYTEQEPADTGSDSPKFEQKPADTVSKSPNFVWKLANVVSELNTIVLSVIFLLIGVVIGGIAVGYLSKKKLQNHNTTTDDETSTDADSLKSEIQRLEGKNTKLEKEKQQLSEENQESARKLNQKLSELQDKIAKLQPKVEEPNRVLEKIKNADFQQEYAAKVFNYLTFIEGILQETDKKCKETGNVVMYALLQQAFSVTFELAKWKQICSDIKEYGIAVQNKDLKNCFQSDKTAEQLKAFRTLLISKLIPITNAILILCEANSNLSKFGVDNVADIETAFKSDFSGVKNKAEEIGIKEIAEVKLFTKLDDHPDVNSESGKISFPYSTVNLDEKDDIAEIIQFGMKTEFDETKTKVLIK